MSSHLRLDLFVEDHAHEELLKSLLNRVGQNEGFDVSLQVRTARGGYARAINEFTIYQDLMEKGLLGGEMPDLMIIAIDGNCETFTQKKREIESATKIAFRHMLVSACPNPHIERWFLADPDSFHRVVGHRPTVGQEKCARGHYKQILRTAIRQGGHPQTLGGIEFASDLAAAMDLYRAGREDSSLKAFLDDFRDKLRSLPARGGAMRETR